MFRPMRRSRQQVSREECVRVLEEARRGTLAVIGDEGYPYAVPIDFRLDPEEDRIYFHCAREGHKMDAIRACDKVCLTAWDRGYQKEGHWSWYVTSVVAMGRAAEVTDETRRREKLRFMAEKYYPDAEELEAELEKDIGRVCLMEIRIEHMTGKLVHEQ